MTIGGAATCPGIFLAGSWGPSCWCSRARPSCAAPAQGQAAAEDANAAALKEIEHLAEETRKLRTAGKTAEAIAAAEAMLAIERKILREDDADLLAVSLSWLAEL